MIRGKARIDVAQVMDGSYEKTCADNQQQAEADLQRHAGAAELHCASGTSPDLLFQRLSETRIPELHRRSEAEEQAGNESSGRGIEQNPPIEGGGKGGVLTAPGHPGDERCQGTRRDKETEGCARYAEQKAFCQQLAKDLTIGRTQCKTHGEFAYPACGPH